MVKNLPANTGDTRDVGLIRRLRRSSEVENGSHLQYSCLKNPRDRGAWWGPWGHKESDTTEHTHPNGRQYNSDGKYRLQHHNFWP